MKGPDKIKRNRCLDRTLVLGGHRTKVDRLRYVPGEGEYYTGLYRTKVLDMSRKDPGNRQIRRGSGNLKGLDRIKAVDRSRQDPGTR